MQQRFTVKYCKGSCKKMLGAALFLADACTPAGKD